MYTALELFYYNLSKFVEFSFNSYIFPGVSLGMLGVCSSIMIVLLTYTVAIPKVVQMGVLNNERKKESAERYQKNYNSNSNNAN